MAGSSSLPAQDRRTPGSGCLGESSLLPPPACTLTVSPTFSSRLQGGRGGRPTGGQQGRREGISLGPRNGEDRSNLRTGTGMPEMTRH